MTSFKTLKNENGKGGWIILLAILLMFILPIVLISYKASTNLLKRSQQLATQSEANGAQHKDISGPLTPEEEKEMQKEMGEQIKVFMVPYFLLVAVVWGMSAVWIYFDAGNRGKSGLLVMLLAMLCAWPFSLLFWVVIRPGLNTSPAS